MKTEERKRKRDVICFYAMDKQIQRERERQTDRNSFCAFIYFWRVSLFLFMAKIKCLKRTLKQLEGFEIQPKRFVG